ncbi:RNA-directed DNA polymerase, eukaryota, reverse transcriptase zinc-binding domain protein [Tanacetum coccineum]
MGTFFENVKKIKKRLDDIQSRIDADPNNTCLREQGVDLVKEYLVALEYEEKLLLYTRGQVPIQFVKHFQIFLGEQNNRECLDMGGILFPNKIDNQEAGRMINEVSSEEIKAAMFDIDDNKASGPDGFTAKFFKKVWEVIGNDVCEAVKEFFSKGKPLGELNATLITLVPKVSTPNKVSEFRPIACCNVVYKCISKIITSRIKNALDSILLKGYDCVNGPKRYAMKNDIQKAYDTVNWKFLEQALRMFGFHDKMVHWIMTCVATPSYTIYLNGERHGSFKGGRGLRQRDPLSPYLFTIVMEELEITHLCFADDLLVLCHGDVNSVSVIKKALEKFSNVSGLYPNLGKSTIFCGSVNNVTINHIMQIFPFKRGKLPVRYLGVPLVSKKISVKDCKGLIDKASVFKLPKLVIKDIEKLFKGFMWNNGELQRGKVKIAWKEICQPKQNGVLGLKPLDNLNKALLVKHL